MTKERAQHLMAVLQRSFNNSKEEWRHYCKTIMSSDFLAGKTYHNFDLRIDWAIKFQTVQKIKEKAYGVKDIDQNQDTLLKLAKDFINTSFSKEEKEIRERLLSKFGVKTYKSWFEKVQISDQKDLIIFKTESLFAKNYLERAFKYPMQDILPIPFEITL